MSLVVSLLRGAYQLAGLFFALLAIPLAFDVGGEQCGVAFSFLLAVIYVCTCTWRWLFRRTKIYVFTSFLYYCQVLAVPPLLLVHLSFCPQEPKWIARAVLPWQLILTYATGLFTLLEGFCTLVVIQACGRSIAPKPSEPAFFLVLSLASIVLSIDFYLLMRVYLLPGVLGVATATLIGVALTLAVGAGVHGIISRRGGVVEATLLLSYVVYQIYLALTDFHSARSENSIVWSAFSSDVSTELPLAITQSCAGFAQAVASLTPAGIKALCAFCYSAIATVSPSVLVSLFVRLASYLFALRLVPFVKHQTPRVRRGRSRLIAAIYAYSPVLILAVYTHLLLQHVNHIVYPSPNGPAVLPLDFTMIWANSRQAWQFWAWANVFSVLVFYAVELAIGPKQPRILIENEDVSDEEIEIQDISMRNEEAIVDDFSKD